MEVKKMKDDSDYLEDRLRKKKLLPHIKTFGFNSSQQVEEWDRRGEPYNYSYSVGGRFKDGRKFEGIVTFGPRGGVGGFLESEDGREISLYTNKPIKFKRKRR